MDFGSILSFTIEQAFGPLAIVYCLAAIGLNVVLVVAAAIEIWLWTAL